MLKALDMINAAKLPGQPRVVVDLHPDRPDLRGMRTPAFPVSLEPDPTFDEIAAHGGEVVRNAEAHTVLDNMFLISGEIPRVTPYEVGIKGGLRFSEASGEWTSDEAIRDERLVMCNLKGELPYTAHEKPRRGARET